VARANRESPTDRRSITDTGGMNPEITTRSEPGAADQSPTVGKGKGAGVGTSVWRPGTFRRRRDDFPANRPYGEQTTPYGTGARSGQRSDYERDSLGIR